MSFSSRSGCPMCGIVSYASTSTSILTHNLSDVHSRRPFTDSSRRDRSNPDILYRDENFTVYEERDHAVSSRGHIIICFKYFFSFFLSLFSLVIVCTFPPYTLFHP